MLTSDELLDYFYHHDTIGQLAAADDVVTVQVGDVSQGLVLRLSCRINQHILQTAKIKVYGDPIAIASLNYLVAQIQPLKIDSIMTRLEEQFELLKAHKLKLVKVTLQQAINEILTHRESNYV